MGEPIVTGYDRLPPGTACVVGVWAGWCLVRQRHGTASVSDVRLADDQIDELARHDDRLPDLAAV